MTQKTPTPSHTSFGKRLWAVALLALSTLHIPACGPAAPTPAARDTLRLLDINIWSGLTYAGTFWIGEYNTAAFREKRYQALLQQIRELNPDVIGLHEVNPIPEYAQRIAKDLDYDVYYHMGVTGVRVGAWGFPANMKEGDVILAKRDLQMEVVGRLQLSGDAVGNHFSFNFGDATQILGVKLTNRGKPFYVFATHWRSSPPDIPALYDKVKELQQEHQIPQSDVDTLLDKFKKQAQVRLEEAKKTIAFIKEKTNGQPFFLMGDFNANAASPEIKALLQEGWFDTFAHLHPNDPGTTWDPANNRNHPIAYKNSFDLEKAKQNKDLEVLIKHHFHNAIPRRLDYIFAGPKTNFDTACTIDKSQVVLDKVINGVHTSDHYGIYAEITCKP